MLPRCSGWSGCGAFCEQRPTLLIGIVGRQRDLDARGQFSDTGCDLEQRETDGVGLIAAIALLATTTVASAEVIDWTAWCPGPGPSSCPSVVPGNIVDTSGTATGITDTFSGRALGFSDGFPNWLPSSSYMGEFKQTSQKSRRIFSKLLFSNGFCQFRASQIQAQ